MEKGNNNSFVENITLLRRIFVIVSVSIFTACVSTLIVYTVLANFQSPKDSIHTPSTNNEDESNPLSSRTSKISEYEHDLNIHDHDTSGGMIRITDGIEQQRIPTFHTTFITTSEDKYHLISYLEEQGEKFKCTGSCTCFIENENERRSTQTSKYIKNGIIFLVSSISSLLALRTAEEYFHDFCETEICDPHHHHQITSKVEECEPIILTRSSDEENDIDDDDDDQKYKKLDETEKQIIDILKNTISEEQFEKEEREKAVKDNLPPVVIKFLCDGHCVLPLFLFQYTLAYTYDWDRIDYPDGPPEGMLQDWIYEKYEECRRLSMELEIEIEKDPLRDDVDPMTWGYYNMRAREKFLRHHLKPYCLENSVVEDWNNLLLKRTAFNYRKKKEKGIYQWGGGPEWFDGFLGRTERPEDEKLNHYCYHHNRLDRNDVMCRRMVEYEI